MDRAASALMVEKAAQAKQASDENPAIKPYSPRPIIAWPKRSSSLPTPPGMRLIGPCKIYGGRGWSELYRVGRHLQDVRVCRIYEGTDEIMQLKIASALLGKDYAAFS